MKNRTKKNSSLLKVIIWRLLQLDKGQCVLTRIFIYTFGIRIGSRQKQTGTKCLQTNLEIMKMTFESANVCMAEEKCLSDTFA